MLRPIEYVYGGLFFALALFPLSLGGQDCSCLEDLDYVAEQIEEHHPGYRYFTRGQKGTLYEQGLQDLRGELDAECVLEREECAEFINRYFKLVPDRHLQAHLASREERHVQNPKPLITDFEILPEGIPLIRLSSFNSRYNAQLDSFYRYIGPRLRQHSALIIDIRVNGGGRKRNMEKLLELLRNRAFDFERIAVLQSRRTGSAAEHFLIRSKRKFRNRLRTFGQNSYGALAYGGTDGYRTPNLELHFRLPKVVFKRYRRYESVGVTPEVLTPEDEALEQALEWLGE